MDISQAKDIVIGGKSVSQLYLQGRLIWERYRESDEWEAVNWGTPSSLMADGIWNHDGHTYYNDGIGVSYELVKNADGTKSWVKKIWNGRLTDTDQQYEIPVEWLMKAQTIWHIGSETYLSVPYIVEGQYRYFHGHLNKVTGQWETQVWNNLPNYYTMNGSAFYEAEDGQVYCILGGIDSVLDKQTNTWSSKSFSIRIPLGDDICKINGVSYYGEMNDWYAYSTADKDFHKVDIRDDAEAKEQGMNSRSWSVWSDGHTYYCNAGFPTSMVLDVATMTWKVKEWKGHEQLEGFYVWTDGEDTYYSEGRLNYRLVRK